MKPIMTAACMVAYSENLIFLHSHQQSISKDQQEHFIEMLSLQ